MKRRFSKTIRIGNKKIGGNERVAIQSMLNIPPEKIDENVKSALELERAGCDIIRVAVPNKNSVGLIEKLKEKINIPIVADIHFDYRLAIESVAAGADKIRINPGNIGDEERVKAVADACRVKDIPIRIGVNSGSIEKSILKEYGGPTAEAMCKSAFYHVSLLERFDFDNIVLSLKSSDLNTMVKAYEFIAEKCTYPLHLGVTEAGTPKMGLIKSSIGIGSLLLKGIGDTIRVSLTADPILEVEAGKNILKAINPHEGGVKIISCPTCGRTKIDIIKIVNEAEKRLSNCKKNIKVAIMGCAVNGPGEAREADIGIAGGDGVGVIFKNGKIIKKVNEKNLVDELILEIEKL